MDAFLVSTSIVALAEIGDKTQLLAFVLAAQFRRPWPIIWGILVATVANHAFAAALGAWLTSLVSPESLRWILGISFLAMAAWILIPDKLDDDRPSPVRLGVFATTLLAFFLAESPTSRPCFSAIASPSACRCAWSTVSPRRSSPFSASPPWPGLAMAWESDRVSPSPSRSQGNKGR